MTGPEAFQKLLETYKVMLADESMDPITAIGYKVAIEDLEFLIHAGVAAE